MARYTIDFSTNAVSVIREIEKVNRAIAQVAQTGRSVSINLDASSLKTSLNTTFRQLDSEIEKLERRLNKLKIGEKPFRKTAASLGYKEGQAQLGRMIAEPLRLRGQAQSFTEGSSVRLQKEMQALQIEASMVKPASEQWANFQSQIGQINTQLQRSQELAGRIQLSGSLGAMAPGSLNQLETKLTLLRSRAREISPDTTEWKKLNREILDAEKNIEKLSRKPISGRQRLGAAGGAFLYGGGMGGGIGSALGGIAGGLMGGVPGAFTGAAIGQLADGLGQFAAGVAKTVAEVNKSRIALAGVVKDTKDYDFALQAATQASKTFLLPIDQATRQFTKLQASVAGAGYQTSDTKQVFNGIAAAIIATGGSTEDLNGALTATAQVFSKGKVTAEELRGQIGERLPGAFTIFAQAIGKTPAQLDEALQKGEVRLSDFLKFTQELTKRYAETAKQLGDAPENAGARLQVALTAAAVSYGGFFQVVGAGFQDGITDVLNFALANENGIKRVVTVFVAGFGTLQGLIQKFTKFLVDAFNQAFTYLLNNLETVLQRIEDAINRASAASSLTPQRIDDLQTQARKATEQKYGAKVFGLNTGIVLDQGPASTYYNQYFNNLIDQATRSPGRKKYTDALQNTLFPDFKPSSFGAGLGKGGVPREGTAGEGGKPKKGKKERESMVPQLQLELELSKQLFEIDKLIGSARLADNTALVSALELQKTLAEIANQRKQVMLEQIPPQEQMLKLQDLSVKAERAILESRLKLQLDLQAEREKMQEDLEKITSSYQEELRYSQMYNDLVTSGISPAIAKIRIDVAKTFDEHKKNLDTQIEQLEVQKASIELRIAELNAIKAKTPMQEKELADAKERLRILIEELKLRGLLRGELPGAQAGATAAAIQAAGPRPDSVLAAEAYDEAKRKFEELTNPVNMLTTAAQGLGSAFSDAFSQAVTGSMTAQEALSSFFSNLGKMFIDMAAEMIAQYMVMKAIGLIASFFPGGANMGGAGYFDPLTGRGTAGPNFGLANGGIINGHFMPVTPFASGGMVTGPTLGLVGEGRFNEAVVPLPNGKSIPVELGGASGNNIATNITVNVSNGQAQSQMSGSGGNKLGRELDAAVKDVILREVRPGGIIYSSRR